MSTFSPEALQDYSAILEACRAHLEGESFAFSEPAVPGASLHGLEQKVRACTRCAIAAERNQAVFGQGNPLAKVMLIGEAPNQQEDLEGLAFAGPAGTLLTQMLQAINLEREQVYITNIIKCSPPEHRDPHPDEGANCREYLDAQIALIRPLIICTLGRVATQSLLKTDESISSLRGRIFSYHGALLLPTFHPSYLLRNQEKKKDAWKDLKLLRKKIDESA